jgi:cytochrome b pre-mRNA-processing protein 3
MAERRQAAARPPWWRRLVARWDASRRRREVAHALYLAAVAQARQPAFFSDRGVPDTHDGRFELIGLHVVLVTRRLRREGAAGAALARQVLEVMIADLDRNMREMGVGDLSVGRQVQRLVASFLGRAAAVDPALEHRDPGPIRTTLERNLFQSGASATAAQLAWLTDYLLRQDAALGAQPGAALLAGRAEFAPLGEGDGPRPVAARPPGAAT